MPESPTARSNADSDRAFQERIAAGAELQALLDAAIEDLRTGKGREAVPAGGRPGPGR